jgi:cytochrome c2
VEFDPFVEREFPFITTFLLVTDGESENLYPENNIVARCLALILGEQSYACFDTDMLRWAAAWTGDFVPLEGVSQIAYPDFLSRNDRMPWLSEQPHLITGLYPGWSTGEPLLEDPRLPAPHPREPSWGPVPQEIGRWNGIYLTDNGPVLSYTAGETEILEKPGAVESENRTVFTRTFRIHSPGEELVLAAGEVPDAVQRKAESKSVILEQAGGETATYFALISNGDQVRFEVTRNSIVTVLISPSASDVEFTLLAWNGSTVDFPELDVGITDRKFTIPEYRNGWTNPWPEPVYTRGKLAPDTLAYVTDELTLPVPNPWNRNVRAVDVAFFNDGRAAVVTFDGDVWITEGISQDLNSIRWNRFASGLYEPQSIQIVDGEIYTYGKDGIIRLHDLNGNGTADFYENFSNLMAQSVETREWASDFVPKPGGGFYVAKGAALDMGPLALTEAVTRGIRAGSQHSGVILDISKDGRSAEIFASGFRGPYLGIHPDSGLLTASDQEGNHVPSTPILTINKNDYFGVSTTAHREPVPEITPPLLWIPHHVDRSGTSQTWLLDKRIGPISGSAIHFSYGRPGLFRMLIDSTAAGIQGGVWALPGHFPVPTMKGKVNPADGQLYIAGFTLWGTNSDGMTGLLRLRYTGKPNYSPSGFKVREEGIVIRFDSELDSESVSDISGYRVERWNYQRTDEYGSGHFRLDGAPGQELLPVFSAHLSRDRKSIFLAVPNLEPVDQMQIAYRLVAADGTKVEDTFWFTVHYTEELDFMAEGFTSLNRDELFSGPGVWEDVAVNGAPVSAERGSVLFQRMGCMGCHTVDGSTGTGVGPTMKDLYGSERNFRDGSTAIADENYLRQKIKNPGTSIVAGYDEGMPSFLGILSEDEINSVILYIKSLSN